MELGSEDVSLLKGGALICYVQASMELGPEDVEKCPHFRERPYFKAV